uniref:Uncharacterized protein n=1 Tax=Glossina pallidipes TaxID=7398 RepID=A0A1A9ZG92_GLOPL
MSPSSVPSPSSICVICGLNKKKPKMQLTSDFETCDQLERFSCSLVGFPLFLFKKTVASNELGVEQTPDDYEYKKLSQEAIVKRKRANSILFSDKDNHNDSMHNMLLLQPDIKHTKQV